MEDRDARNLCAAICGTFPQIAKYARDHSPDKRLTYRAWLAWLYPLPKDAAYKVLDSWKGLDDLPANVICAPAQALAAEVRRRSRPEQRRTVRDHLSDKPIQHHFTSNMLDCMQRLKEVHRKHQQGTISASEYHSHKAAILADVL